MNHQEKKRLRTKNRKSGSSYLGLPHYLINHRNFQTLSPRATKLLIDIAAQYRGSNNGDLCAPMSLMRERGWRSSDQLFKARKELLDRGLIVTSRQGGLNKCSLFALTWLPIDECQRKLDISSSITPSHLWEKWSVSYDGSN
jgi:hypothetical protein